MMKFIFVALFFISFSAAAQYRESGDTIFINNKILLPGDTIHLGLGSDPYKNFLFVNPKPNIFNVSISNGQSYLTPLPSSLAFGFLIYKGMQWAGKKAVKNKTGNPLFLLNGTKGMINTCYIQFTAAIAAKEIIL